MLLKDITASVADWCCRQVGERERDSSASVLHSGEPNAGQPASTARLRLRDDLFVADRRPSLVAT